MVAQPIHIVLPKLFFILIFFGIGSTANNPTATKSCFFSLSQILASLLTRHVLQKLIASFHFLGYWRHCQNAMCYKNPFPFSIFMGIGGTTNTPCPMKTHFHFLFSIFLGIGSTTNTQSPIQSCFCCHSHEYWLRCQYAMCNENPFPFFSFCRVFVALPIPQVLPKIVLF